MNQTSVKQTSVEQRIIDQEINKAFGALITRLIRRENLSFEEARSAFCTLLANDTTEHQQGAFLAALCAKGETREEVKGAWQAIYDVDTVKVDGLDQDSLVENTGTGMDSFKTFNISTAASIVAAACGSRLARHGSRALSSTCGTVDLAEALGVDVECPPALVAQSLRECGLGLFNGMSPQVHPKALGRVLSKIHFGSTLNISASLANPAMPRLAVRGVYSPEMLHPVAAVMHEIGYRKAIVLHGHIDGSDQGPELGMDEASVCGSTSCIELLPDGNLRPFSFRPEEVGLCCHPPEALAPEKDAHHSALGVIKILSSHDKGARKDAVLLNAAMILWVDGHAEDISQGVRLATKALEEGRALATLKAWVRAQNRQPEKGEAQLEGLLEKRA